MEIIRGYNQWLCLPFTFSWNQQEKVHLAQYVVEVGRA